MNRNDQLTEADMRRLFLQRMMKLGLTWRQRSTDPNIQSWYAIALTGSV